jgi:branched-chain amino acid transport system ATP-binding protein
MTSPAADVTSAAVSVRGLSAGYQRMPVVHDLDIDVAPGEVVGLLGANGAGKTTALLTIAGAIPSIAGDVAILGVADPREDLASRVRRGLALITDDRAVFRTLSTGENLRLGCGEPERALAAFPELKPLLKRQAGLLSGGEQQMLGLGRVLAASPKVLLADELSMGLAPLIVERLLTAVRRLADSGCAVILVEQQIRRVLDIADRGYVLRQGRVELSGTALELKRMRRQIEQSYLSVAVESA